MIKRVFCLAVVIFLAISVYAVYNRYPISCDKESVLYKKYHKLPRFYWEGGIRYVNICIFKKIGYNKKDAGGAK